MEKGAGGGGLRYSFDIKAGAATHEVGVEAVTGAVLENSIEGAESGLAALERPTVTSRRSFMEIADGG